MRWFLTLLLAVPALTVRAGEDEAEKVFREAGKHLRAAKTVQVRFDVKLKDGSAGGVLILGDGDRVRADGRGKFGAGTFTAPTLIGDGAKIHSLPARNPTKDTVKVLNDSPKGLGISLRDMLLGPGILLELGAITRGKTPAADAFTVSGFKLGGKEKVGDVEARVLQYTVTVKGPQVTVWLGAAESTFQLKQPEKVSVKLWVDARSNAPVKLEMRLDVNGTACEFGETFTLNGEIDAKLFDVPK